MKESGFENLYVQPAAGDGGGALGAALWAYNTLLGKPRNFQMDHAYWGRENSDSEIGDFLTQNNIPHTRYDNEDKLLDAVVNNLTSAKVIGWAQGRFEWGPRALGSRSILADPRNPDMKDIVNTKIKFREPYRPFAPSVLAESAEKYFELPNAMNMSPARYMLYVVPVKEDAKKILPAITHVDGTGRLQTVFKAQSPRYYKMIEKFGQATGVPVVMNTSFNLKGEPIVNTPANAFNTFEKSEMDALVLENFIIEKPSSN
jgi:carbamoyltransferase